jgi:UDP-N-acetylglucosamine--N-acetylmuramyl-(pentapeptide) pyrophosphoryl-undecaprenol N-acetylglucosamine transferase
MPNLAVVERLADARINVVPHLLVSQRAIDRAAVEQEGVEWTALPAQPFSVRGKGLMRFASGHLNSKAIVKRLIRERHVAAVIATGGFVSGPAIEAARACRVPCALITLDAVAGRASRHLAKRCTQVFSAYENPVGLPGAWHIGYPLRFRAVSALDASSARAGMGLQTDRPTLLVVGGSQAAETINKAMAELITRTQCAQSLRSWQVLHLAGERDAPMLRDAYARAGIAARVESFCRRMGLAWASADLVISRAGAGGVAEAWANAVPTIFIPYPFHKDQHQRLNALPLMNLGGAVLLRDRVEPAANVTELAGPLMELMGNARQRQAMREALRRTPPRDGAAALAEWVEETLRG